MPLSHHKKSFLQVILSATILLLGAAVFTFILYETVNLRAEIQNSSASVLTQAGQTQAIARLASIAKETTAGRNQLQSLVVAPGGGVSFISEIEKTATTSNVALTVSSVGILPPKNGNPGKIVLALSFSGSYKACMRFIELIETYPGAVSIQNLLLHNGDEEWQGSANLSILSFDTP